MRVDSVEPIQVPQNIINEAFKDVLIKPITSKISSESIQLLYHSRYHYLLCPNTATSFALSIYYLHYLLCCERNDQLTSFVDFELPPFETAYEDVMQSSYANSPCLFCLNTAHPGKFPYFVAEALNAPAGNIMPKDIQKY